MTVAITCYKTSDGQLFEDERKASVHQKDLIGEMLDGLVADDDRGNVTRTDRFNILTKMLNDPELKKKVTDLYNALNYED